MTPKLKRLLQQAAAIIVAEFKEEMIEGNGYEEGEDWIELWYDCGYEELDHINDVLGDHIKESLK